MADQTINNMSITWNSGGTTFSFMKVNVTDTASALGSLLQDFQVGGAAKWTVRKDGTFTAAGDGNIAGDLNVTGNVTITGTLTGGGITGVVTGPSTSTDNTLARFDGTSGDVLQGSGIVVGDTNNVSGMSEQMGCCSSPGSCPVPELLAG